MDKNQKQDTATKTEYATMLTVMFAGRAGAESAYKALREKGYTKENIYVLMSVEARNSQFPNHVKEVALGGVKVVEGETKGSGIKALANDIAAVESTRLIPGLGIVVAGPIAAKLAGNGINSLKNGIVGLLVSAGVSEKWAKVYEHGLRSDHIVIGVCPRNDEDRAFLIDKWEANNGKEISK